MAKIDPSCLLVRKLPDCLRSEDKESFLKFFGATDVSVMAPRGQLKNCAFATFSNPMDTKMALSKLHQLEVFGSRLVVVYKTLQNGGSVDDRMNCDQIKRDDCKTNESKQLTNVPGVTYRYPPPTQSIISNIANAIAGVPQLYTQVLHLMNKMNLPPPFGQPLPGPLLPADGTREQVASDESEIDSDNEISYKTGEKRPRLSKHRRLVFKHILTDPPAKKLKEQELRQTKRINIIAPTELQPAGPVVVENVFTISTNTSKPQELFPAATNDTPLPAGRDDEIMAEEFIEYSQLQLNRATNDEMAEYSAFSNYSTGEPSMRLYIKNLAKQVTEKDIRFIYGRYIDWESEQHKNSFDVRVMQKGRMKGQAFVGLPSEDISSVALKETHGYKLYDRPIVVQFARSTKAKEISSTDV